MWDKSTDSSPSLVYQPRKPLIAITIPVLLDLGALGEGTGISSYVLSKSRSQELSVTIDEDVQCLQQGIDDFSNSLSSLTEVILQNRRVLDLLFFTAGRDVSALKEECCSYVDKTEMVNESIRKVSEGLEKRQREREMRAGTKFDFQPLRGCQP